MNCFNEITGATATTASKAVANLDAYLSKMYRTDFGAFPRVGSSITFADGQLAMVAEFVKSDKTFTNKDGETEHYNNPVWTCGSQKSIIAIAQALVNDGKLRTDGRCRTAGNAEP